MPELNESRLAIRVCGLSYHYADGAEPALEAVSLAVRRGECFGLLGPNGAGKTTLLSILTGMLPVQTGSVEIADLPLAQGREIKQVSAIVPQDFAFYPGLTGRENLNFFAGLYGLQGKLKQERIEEAVAFCQLTEVLNKRAEAYSGGLKRRLNLAIGLLNKPQILYLDEPTVGIDAQSRNFILEAIKRLKGSGITVVYTSHYMEEVQALCDEVAIIDHGRVVLQSRLADLLEEQSGLLELSLRQAPSPEQLQHLAALGKYELLGLRLKLKLAAGHSMSQALQHLESAGLHPRQLQYGISRLEDVYLSLTKHELRE